MATAKTNGSTDEHIEQLRKDVDALRQDFASLLENAGELAEYQTQRGVERSREAGKAARDYAVSARDDLETQVRDNPLVAAAAAVAAGFVLAKLLER